MASIQITLDPALIVAAKGGDLEAFSEIVSAFERPLFRYIYHLVNNTQDAQDLTQETFVKLYKNIKSAKEQKNFRSWLYTIATHIVYDWLRARKNKVELLLLDDPDSHIETIDERSSYNYIENAHDIQQALAVIKPVYRTVVLLYYFQGFSYTEIASIVTIPVNTVKTYLRRAKSALQQELTRPVTK